MKKTIAILPGDGIGEEVMSEALKVLNLIEKKFGHKFDLQKGYIGGAGFDKYGSHFPEETKKICENSDAILFGSVGGPVSEQSSLKWKGCETNSILSLRKTFSFNANFRPIKVYKELSDSSPLKNEIIEKGINILFIRELNGDIYFGEHKREINNGKIKAIDIAEYTEDQIESIVKIAFETAINRTKKLVSIDKANVLETSKLWREIVEKTAKKYTEVSYEHMLVDNAAMQLIKTPFNFDVILCPNLFGDILSDEGAILSGSIGLMPSASINKEGFGMYEPSGGSAYELTGKNIANPIAQILSFSMLLRYSFGLNDEANLIDFSVDEVIKNGFRTADIFVDGKGTKLLNTNQMGDEICKKIESIAKPQLN